MSACTLRRPPSGPNWRPNWGPTSAFTSRAGSWWPRHRKSSGILVSKQRIEQDAGLETEVLTGTALRDFAPYLAEDLAGATYCGREGHANPLLAAPAFAARAIEAGACVRTHAAVTSIDDLDGRPGPLQADTAAGPVEAHRVVNAAGAWAGDVAALSGLILPLRAEGLHVNVTEPREPMLVPMVQHIGRRLTLKQTGNGTFIIGGGWPARPEAPPERYSVRWPSAAGNAAIALRVMPARPTSGSPTCGPACGRPPTISTPSSGSSAIAPVISPASRRPGLRWANRGPDAGRVDERGWSRAIWLGTVGAGLPAAYRPDRAGVLTRN